MRMKLCDPNGSFKLLMKFERFEQNMCLTVFLMLSSRIIQMSEVENQYTCVMG